MHGPFEIISGITLRIASRTKCEKFLFISVGFFESQLIRLEGFLQGSIMALTSPAYATALHMYLYAN